MVVFHGKWAVGAAMQVWMAVSCITGPHHERVRDLIVCRCSRHVSAVSVNTGDECTNCLDSGLTKTAFGNSGYAVPKRLLIFPIPPWLKNSLLSQNVMERVKSPVNFLLRAVTDLSQDRSWLTVGNSILLHQISPVLACRNPEQCLVYPWIFFKTLESDSALVLV